jgi:hypothetical protein
MMTVVVVVTFGEPTAVAVAVRVTGAFVNCSGLLVRMNEFALADDTLTASAVELLVIVTVGAPGPIMRLLFASSGTAAIVCGTRAGITNPLAALPLKHGDDAESKIDLGTPSVGTGLGVGANGVGVTVGA